LLGRQDVVVIDIRFGRDWNDATLKIKGAVREDPMKPGQWLDKYPKDKMMIFYCA
jgi:rhodanese-related sulfurtransferase